MTDVTTPQHRREDGADVIEGRKRILITGSRTWPNQPAIAAAILKQWVDWGRPPITLVHGGARGADRMAADVVSEQVAANPEIFRVEEHPALWDVHGKAAGFIRNAEMVALGADVVLAFVHNNSRGATHALGLAAAADIPIVVYRIDDNTTRSRE